MNPIFYHAGEEIVICVSPIESNLLFKVGASPIEGYDPGEIENDGFIEILEVECL